MPSKNGEPMKKTKQLWLLLLSLGLMVLGSACTALTVGRAPHTERLEVGLSAEQAACLAAEVLAYECSAAHRDPRHPTAFARELGNDAWLIRWARGARGPLLPDANGHFVRGTIVEPDLQGTQANLRALPRVSFVASRAFMPRGHRTESVQIHVNPSQNATAIVTIETSDDTGRSRLRTKRIVDVLDMATLLVEAVRSVRSDDSERALALLETATTRHAAGFSTLHDPLLARAWLLQAQLHTEAGRLNAARRAVRQARMLVPGAASLALLQARLQERLARPQRMCASLALALQLVAPGSAEERVIGNVHRRGRRAVEHLATIRSTIEQSQRALGAGDWATAKSWADRALDLGPSRPEAMRCLADSLDGLGRTADARAIRLLVLRLDRATPSDVLALVRADDKAGHSSMALRWLLRHGNRLPEVLAEPEMLDLARRVGWERTLRIMQTEQMATDMLPVALAEAERAQTPRTAFIARLMAGRALEAQSLPNGRTAWVRAPDSAPAVSGVRFGSTPPK
jgi:Tfp pilus assembly protein PilF